MYKISVVSYLNSKAFIKGLNEYNPGYFNFELDVPAVCAQKLIDGTADIGLIPVATIPLIPDANIISDYCISAKGKVNSVFLFSSTSVENISTIYLDNHSRSSNMLCTQLVNNFWNIKVEWKKRESDDIELKENEAMVLIGDRTFDKIDTYPYQYDLADEWFKFTGLPFVFAAWVANKNISSDFIKEFNAALSFGLSKIDDVINQNQLVDFDVQDYLKNKIQYELNEQKIQAIQRFLDMEIQLSHTKDSRP